MNFYGGIILLPYTKVFANHLCDDYLIFHDFKKIANVQKSSINNLFCDGIWQQPVKSVL